jgi:drug/metabolite transporter (DMT)-like permease
LKSQQEAYKYALIAVLLWSTVATAFKVSLNYLTPLQLVFYAVIASIICLYFILLYQKKLPLVMQHIKTNYLQVALLGFINPFLYYIVLFEAYDRLPAQEAQAINYTWALMLAYLSVIFLKQKLTFKDIIAGILCYFGVLIISTRGEPFSLNFSNLDGVSLALLSTVLWAMYWIMNTKSKVDPIVGLLSNFLFSLPMILVFGLVTDEFHSMFSVQGILAATYVGLFEMGIAFVFWLKAMQVTPSTSKIANLIFISPFISLIFIHFIVGEEIYISTLFGLIAIIFGLFLQQSQSNK